MLVADPGLGKTSMALSALDTLRLAGSQFFPALVLAPKRVADVVWTGEIAKWDAFQELKPIRIAGTAAERLEALRRPVADVYICNYEWVEDLVALFPPEKWPFKIVIADESSKLKGFRLQKGRVRAQALSMIARHTGRWWNLTGTPMPNGAQDLWGQLYFLDFGERLKRSYTAFFEAYFTENRYSRRVTPLPGTEALIPELVKDLLVSFRAEDWLPLDKPQYIPIEVQLPAKAMAQYKSMEKDLLLKLTDAEIRAGTAAARSSKLLQIASGSIYDENTLTHELHDAKIEGLQDVMDQIAPAPLLVSTHWKFDVPRILRRFPDARVYTGQKEQDLWDAGKLRMMLLPFNSPHGLNLAQRCHDVCFYGYSWSGENWRQMLDRVGPVRQLQAGTGKITRVWSIRAAGTMESDVIDSNEGKISVEDAFKRARARIRSENGQA